MAYKPETKEALHGCSEVTFFHDPGSWNSSRSRSLASVAIVGRGSEACPIYLADWFTPSPRRTSPLLLVQRALYLRRQRDASAYRCTHIPGQSGSLSMGTQSHVYCCPDDHSQWGHPLSFASVGRLCPVRR